MNDRLINHLNSIFAPYAGVKSVAELKEDLFADLQERFRELKAEGKDDDTAFEMTLDSIGDIEQTVLEIANLSRPLERELLTNFSGSNLSASDFADVTARKGKFAGSNLRGSDFSGADLTGSSFKSSDVRDAIFDGANLTNCSLATLDLSNASFHKTRLVSTTFSSLELSGARFMDNRMTGVNFITTDLRKTLFINCVFHSVDFKYCDLGGVDLGGQIFTGVKFDKCGLVGVSFKGATLRNVSFIPTFSLSNKYYRSIKTVCFEDAKMDKLTYAVLKGMEADLTGVTIV